MSTITITEAGRERPVTSPASPVPGRIRRAGVGVLSGFTGTFPAVLAFSLLLAALCLFSLARTAAAFAAGGR